jgi:hypothetical protein
MSLSFFSSLAVFLLCDGDFFVLRFTRVKEKEAGKGGGVEGKRERKERGQGRT